MSWLDVLLAVVLLAFGVRGFFRGFVLEAAGLLALVSAVIAAVRWARPATEALHVRQVLPEEMAVVAGGAAVFVGIFLLVTLIGWALDRLAHAFFLGPVVRVAGVAFALVKGAALAGFALLLAQQWAPRALSEQNLEASRLAPPMMAAARSLTRVGGQWIADQAPLGEGATG